MIVSILRTSFRIFYRDGHVILLKREQENENFKIFKLIYAGMYLYTLAYASMSSEKHIMMMG